jgi:hypothetical protein
VADVKALDTADTETSEAAGAKALPELIWGFGGS